jgi:hypothetical protein
MTTVDAYVAHLDAHLVGPSRAKRDLMTEVRDHLTDSRDAYRRAGFDEVTAEARAVEEFGDVREVAPEFQSELGLAQSRRTALTMFVALLAQPVVWRDWLPGFEEQPARLSGLAAAADRLVEVFGAVSIVGAMACVLASGVGTRWVERRRSIVRGTAAYALGTSVLLASLGLLLSSQTHGGGTAVLVAMAWAVALLIVPLSAVARSATRALRAA